MLECLNAWMLGCLDACLVPTLMDRVVACCVIGTNFEFSAPRHISKQNILRRQSFFRQLFFILTTVAGSYIDLGKPQNYFFLGERSTQAFSHLGIAVKRTRYKTMIII